MHGKQGTADNASPPPAAQATTASAATDDEPMAVSPALQALLRQEPELKLWLEHTGYFDAAHRARVVQGIKRLKAAEEERDRILRELHDTTGGLFHRRPASASTTTTPSSAQAANGRAAAASAAAAAAESPPSCDDVPADELLEEQWEEAVASGRLRTTWQREAETVVAYSAPLIATFFLQYSINVASIFAVGRIGKVELGAVSLANMSAAISCLAPFQGLATSLDTLCAQAYGSGHKQLVGLQCQRLACFLLCLSAPVAVLWLFSDRILVLVVPDAESARLAGLYLKIMIFSIPGIILFETGKRFLQAQGLFHATTVILVIAAPFNIFITWLLVWRVGLGFVGAPIAVAVTENLLPVLLVLYVRFVGGAQCWGGLSRRAFTQWWVMIRLALPGMIMVEAEWLAFEIMTLLASRFGTEYLAAQSVLATLATISYQVPFPVSIAASTRVANLIGAGMVNAAKVTARVVRRRPRGPLSPSPSLSLHSPPPPLTLLDDRRSWPSASSGSST
ncbi:hypothetical protein CDD83_6887 [Cordyceps sp. RAO-2017]|nr:hypothetical protein CDD83_6887 [Cordyceps sp. RAO-2017]